MKFFKAQKSFDFEQPDWSMAPELFVIHQILNQRIDIIELAAPCFPNLNQHQLIGRTGMTLEQVVRCALYKQLKTLSYVDLAIALVDSKMAIVFTKMDYGQRFAPQTLQENISRITATVLEKINQEICKLSLELRVETGERMRTDSTAIESNIHYPTNSSLLWDCIRVATRLLRRCKTIFPAIKVTIASQKTAKKLNYKIVTTKGQDKRIPLFKKLLKIQKKLIRQVEQAIDFLNAVACADSTSEPDQAKFRAALQELLPHMQQVADVTYRKEILDEQVPVAEKLFSIFETHTACIVKGGREVVFGHKVNLTTGKSNLIFDVIIEDGNTSDSELYIKTLDKLKHNYALVPRDFASDGCYASIKNLTTAKERGIQNIVFTKIKGNLKNIVHSKKLETMLIKWRSGIEANISNFKRGLEAHRAPWKGYEAFQSFVFWSVIAYNLKILAAALLTNL